MSQMSARMLGSRYELGHRIGAGGYCDVWRAQDIVLDRPVAVKLLRPGYAQDQETLARFRNEAQLAGRLAHVHVARVYDFRDHEPGTPPYLVMELIEGPSLAQVLANGPLSPDDTMDIVAQAAAGLQAAHQAGLVHRDIKPANILLEAGRTVKITDFGISHTLSSAPITGTGMLIGTPHYFPPERTDGERATPAGDLYALGIVGYECLVGAVPFTGTPLEVALAHRDRPLPPPPATVPAEVAAFIGWLTAKDPAARPGNAELVARHAAELRDRLRGRPLPGTAAAALGSADGRTAALGGFPSSGVTAQFASAAQATAGSGHGSWQEPPRPRHRSWVAAWVAAAALVVVAGAFAVMALTSGPGRTSPPAGSHPNNPAAQLSDVSRSILIGEPARVAKEQLRAQGFQVRVIWLFAPHQPAGHVVGVYPAGPQPAGTLITIVAGYGGHSGHGDGGDNGNGNGGGGDGGGG